MHNSILNYLQSSTKLKLVPCLILAAISDWLFFDHQIGWTSGLFVILLCTSYVMHASKVSLTKPVQIILLLITGQALALMENPNTLSFLLIIIGFSGLVFVQKPSIQHNARIFAVFIWRYILVCWFNIFVDYSLFSKYQKKHKSKAGSIFSVFNNWVVPIGLSVVFIMLFSSANPVIEGWVDQIDLRQLFKSISIPRVLFWSVAVLLCWAIIRPRQMLRRIKTKVVQEKNAKENSLISPSSIIRALTLFNLIFLVQTSMDMVYLWGGANLPDGMSHAQYVHRGAYPLIFTAFLAAAFVLIVLKPGSKSENSPLIRTMVYAWVGQNIMLVISSIWRLMLYVEAYKLTVLRIAAIIWMALVAVGLVLIIIRIIKQQDNVWLINKNFIALISTLYICSFINFGGIIAEYNIANSKEVRGNGNQLDLYYLKRNIGTDAIPALVKYSQKIPYIEPEQEKCDVIYDIQGKAHETRCRRYQRLTHHALIAYLKGQLKHQNDDWRGWTLRQYRISKYLAQEGY